MVVLAAIGQLCLLLLSKSIHSKIVQFGVECGIFVAKCLIDMYEKCGVVEDAIHGSMKDRNINAQGFQTLGEIMAMLAKLA